MALLQAVLSDPNQTIITYPTLTNDDDPDNLVKRNFFQRILKHWRQILNILPGLLLLWTAGIQLLWEIREIAIERKHQDEDTGDHVAVPTVDEYLSSDSDWRSETIPYVSTHAEFFVYISVWHIGIAIGSALGVLLNKLLTVKWIYAIGAILISVVAILNLIQLNFEQLQLFLIADAILAGIVYGINHVTVICHAADNSAREIRGTVLRLIAYSKWYIILSAAYVFTIAYPTSETFGDIASIYIISAILTALSIGFLTYNSFTRSIEKQENEDNIKGNIIRIRNDFNYPRRAQKVFDEIKLQLSEDQTDGSNVFGNGNLRPLLLVTGARVLSLLVNNIPILVIITSLSHASFLAADTSEDRITAFSTILSIVLFFKLVIGLITVFLADCISLNRFFYVVAIIWAVFYIVLHIVQETIVAGIVLVAFLLAGLGLDAISYNQLSEAFPLTKRASSIAVVHIIESVIEIILLALYILVFPSSFVIPIAIATIILSICLFIWLPNTHQETLRNARDLFNISIVRQNRKYELAPLDAR